MVAPIALSGDSISAHRMSEEVEVACILSSVRWWRLINRPDSILPKGFLQPSVKTNPQRCVVPGALPYLRDPRSTVLRVVPATLPTLVAPNPPSNERRRPRWSQLQSWLS